MKAIILAAGIGSRLQPMTNNKPKTLVKVNGKPMLGYILDSLVGNKKIKEIIICTGFESSQIINFCETHYRDTTFSYIENKEFQDTNNMFSLYLARDFINDDILIMNADLVFDPEIISSLSSTKGSAVAVERGRYLEESMKITVADNIITGISKKIPETQSYGCSIDIYKIEKESTEHIINEMKKIIENDGDRNQWTEVMLNNLFESQKIKVTPMDIGSNRWCEIDNYDDLAEAEILFNEDIKKLKSKRVFFIDGDGTLAIGNKLIDGAKNFIEALNKSGKHFFITTNNSSKDPQKHLKKFQSMGLKLENKNILVSIQAAIEFLKESNKKSLYWVANKEVSKYIQDSGFKYEETNPQAVLLTYDDEINYSKFCKATKLVRSGIPYYATHCDIVCPSDEGPIPDIGTFIKVIEMTSGTRPNRIFGKPDKSFVKLILNELGLNFNDAVIIGDRLYTDISLASGTSMTSVLVLTGETSREDYEKAGVKNKSDIIIRNLNDIVNYI